MNDNNCNNNYYSMDTEPYFDAPAGLEVGDSCYGEVVGGVRKGIFIRLEDGSEGFSYECAGLRNGSRVMCTLKRLPRGDKRALLGVDSVLEYAA